jgi:hypothetical protein
MLPRPANPFAPPRFLGVAELGRTIIEKLRTVSGSSWCPRDSHVRVNSSYSRTLLDVFVVVEESDLAESVKKLFEKN